MIEMIKTKGKWFARKIGVICVLALLVCLCLPIALAEDGASPAMTLEDAKAIALQSAKLTEDDVLVTKMELDEDDGRQEFEIDFISAGMEYEYEIDALSGQVLKLSTEMLSAKENERYGATYITMDEVKSIVIAAAGIAEADAVFTQIQLDYDDGQMDYEVKFMAAGERHSFDLDAMTGDVLKHVTHPAHENGN